MFAALWISRSVVLYSSTLPAFRRSSSVEASVPRLAHVHYSSWTARTPGEEVVIAIGSNVGNRVANFNRALELMRASGIQVIRHASLYESAPAYVTDQPFFLNSAVSAITSLDPHSLLRVLKDIEGELGRTVGGIRYAKITAQLKFLLWKYCSSHLICFRFRQHRLEIGWSSRIRSSVVSFLLHFHVNTLV